MLLPIAVVFGVLAEPIIDLLYGDEYDGAVVPLQLLAVMTVLYGINTFVSRCSMIARDRPAPSPGRRRSSSSRTWSSTSS